MAGLVIGIGLSVSTCYATEPEDLPWSNETDVIILPPPPPPPPLPITNETDPVIIIIEDSIQEQLYTIYDAMIMQDERIMNGRNSVRKLNATLKSTIVNFVGVVEDLGWKLLDSDAQLQGQIDTQNTYIEELWQEVSRLHQEVMNERAMRNNITIMFGVFCLVVIGATVVINKK
jgi:hypothetical protein